MVWDKAKDGPEPRTKSCPTCGKTVRVPPGTKGVKRDWDIDHIIPWKRIVDAWRGIAKDKPPGRKEVGNRYNDSNNLRLECPSCNRARGASVRGTSSVGRKK